jgi:isopenicillin N synthase-like dioxygenase
MRYTPNPVEIDAKLEGGQYLNGHTDFGLVTLLFAQVIQGRVSISSPHFSPFPSYFPSRSLPCTVADPLLPCSLQIRTDDGAWKDVPYIPDSIVVNTADILSFATNGWLKSTIHRVVKPPTDQRHVKRMGVRPPTSSFPLHP